MLDIAMPEMNGIEVARVVLAKRPELADRLHDRLYWIYETGGSGTEKADEKAIYSC